MSKNTKNILTMVALAALSFVFGWQATVYGVLGDFQASIDEISGSGVDNAEGHNVDLGLFWTVWEQLENEYVEADDISRQEKIYGSIKGLVDSYGDPYTVFMTPKESEDFSASLEGKLEGIGAELTVEDENLVVVSPLKNSPAEKAGLLPGDIIFKVEDEVAKDMTLFEAIMKIRGEKGTTVHLSILRDSVEGPFEVSIVRDNIDIESVTVEMLDEGIVYLSVNQFNDKTNEEFGRAISEMILDEPKGVIVDLRFNGGGYLDIAVELLSYLLPTATDAVVIRERGEEKDVRKTNGNPKILDVPLVVLVNQGSASASEIVAGAIQDHDRGVIMGTQTFGKGSVQEVDSFSDGSSIRLTIAKWFTPDGRSIDEVGLEPDILVEISDEDRENEVDSQKDAAIEYLKNL